MIMLMQTLVGCRHWLGACCSDVVQKNPYLLRRRIVPWPKLIKGGWSNDCTVTLRRLGATYLPAGSTNVYCEFNKIATSAGSTKVS